MTHEKQPIEVQEEFIELQEKRRDIFERQLELINEKLDLVTGSTNKVVEFLLDECERLSGIMLIMAEELQPGVIEILQDGERERAKRKLRIIKREE